MSIDEKALAHTLSFIKQPENSRLIRHAIASYEDAKSSDQPVQRSMDLLKLLGYINAMVGYCQSLRVGTVISDGYMQRMNDHYVPNILKAAQLIAEMVDAAQATKREAGSEAAWKCGWGDAVVDAPSWQWQPIDNAPLGVFVIAGWADEDANGQLGLDDTQVLSFHTTKADWKPGEKAWLNRGSGNHGRPKSAGQWPTHWMYPPAFNQIEGGES